MPRFDFETRDPRGRLVQCGYMDMQAAQNDAPARIDFYGDIVSSEADRWARDDKYPQVVADFMAGLDPKEPLDLYFNSGGGDVWAGIAIHSLLRRHQGKKVATVDGIAASIASVILMAADEIRISLGAQVMIHKPWSLGIGNADYFRGLADRLDGAEKSIVDIYMDHAAEGRTRQDFEDAMRAETWMDATQAAEYFKLTPTQAQAAKPAASTQYAKYLHTPEGLDALDAPEAGAEAPQDALDGKPEQPPTPQENPQNGPTDAQRAQAILADLDLYGYGT